MKSNIFTPMYGNPKYLVNCYTGEIKGVDGTLLKGSVKRAKSGVVKCVVYTIMDNGKQTTVKGHRIVAETKLQRSLANISIGHKNGVNTDNSFQNLLIGKKRVVVPRVPVCEYKNGELVKVYRSKRAFVDGTGISWSTLKRNKGKYSIGAYRWEVDK